VLRGRGTEIEGLPPYLLFLEALQPFIASAAGRALHRRLGRRVVAAGELFPELAKPGRNGSLPPEDYGSTNVCLTTPAGRSRRKRSTELPAAGAKSAMRERPRQLGGDISRSESRG